MESIYLIGTEEAGGAQPARYRADRLRVLGNGVVPVVAGGSIPYACAPPWGGGRETVMCMIELEPCEVWSETERRARKEHRCSSCAGRIAPGERYTVHWCKDDGEVSSGKLCAWCMAARQEFADAHDGTVCQPKNFPGMLEECIADGDEESERRWRPMLAALRSRGRT